MNKKHLLALACVGFISVVSNTVFAGNREGAVTLTLAAGYDYFDSKRNIQNTGIPFVALGYNFTNHWGIEGMLGFFNTNFNNNQHDNRTINGRLFAVDGMYHFSPFKTILEPYVLAGVGILDLNPNREDANNEGNVNAGAGVQLFIDKSIAFQFEARDFYTIVGGKNDVFLDAGINFLFDIC